MYFLEERYIPSRYAKRNSLRMIITLNDVSVSPTNDTIYARKLLQNGLIGGFQSGTCSSYTFVCFMRFVFRAGLPNDPNQLYTFYTDRVRSNFLTPLNSSGRSPFQILVIRSSASASMRRNGLRQSPLLVHEANTETYARSRRWG